MKSKNAWTTALCLALAWSCGTVQAQDAEAFPRRPITWIVAFPAGGSIDIAGRLVAKRVSEILGQPVVIDNRGGAGGRLGAQTVATAKPDGYTQLLTLNTSYTMEKELFTNLTFDPAKDFKPVSILADTSQLLVSAPSMPAKSVKDLIAMAKAKPGKLTFASSGVGGSLHLAMLYLQAMTGIDMTHVPYKGGPAATNDLMSGRVDVMFLNTPAALPFIKSNSLRALGVSTERRAGELPDVPTLAESGAPGFALSVWFGLSVPSATPQPIADRMAAAVRQAIADPAVRKGLEEIGADPVGSTPQEFARRVKAESALWTRTFKQMGMKLE